MRRADANLSEIQTKKKKGRRQQSNVNNINKSNGSRVAETSRSLPTQISQSGVRGGLSAEAVTQERGVCHRLQSKAHATARPVISKRELPIAPSGGGEE